MIPLMLTIFVAGYLMIAFVTFKINKATFALIMCGLLWGGLFVSTHDPNLSSELVVAPATPARLWCSSSAR